MLQLHLELLVRILVGTVLGGAIGYERDLHGRPAGLRTHAIVALASATFMVVSTRFVYFQHYAKDDLVAIDPSRIAASVVSGIGFLGAGRDPPRRDHHPGAHHRRGALAGRRDRDGVRRRDVRRERVCHGRRAWPP